MKIRMKQVMASAAVSSLLLMSGCGGGDASNLSTFINDAIYVAELLDAPVQGVCYLASPSGKTGVTDVNGKYSHAAGDTVTFWLDGTGNNCSGSSSTSTTSVTLGTASSVTPASAQTITQTFILALSNGQQAADTLTALNSGSASAMNVSGLVLTPTSVSNLNAFISSGGSILPTTASGSIDTLYNSVQASTKVLASSSAPTYVVPVAANASTTTSVLQNTVATNLNATAGSLTPPSNLSVLSNSLYYDVSTQQYTQPLSANPTTVYTDTGASFSYYDGAGNVQGFNSVAANVLSAGTITSANIADLYTSGTYTMPITGNTFSKILIGTNFNNGYTYRYDRSVTVNYADASSAILTLSGTNTYTSGPNSGSVYTKTNKSNVSIKLMPLTLAMLAGHTVTFPSKNCNIANNTIAFSSNSVGTGITATGCTSSTPTIITATNIPGILMRADPSGLIQYMGLIGSGLVSGATFVLITENNGSNGINGNGVSSGQPYLITPPFVSVQ